MSLYEVLKASKTNRFPDYWTLLWGRKMSASMIKTLTGVLPLTFTAKSGTAVDWVIYGNDENGTENLVPPIRTANGWKQGYRNYINGYYVPAYANGEWLYDVYIPINSASFTFWAANVSNPSLTFYFYDSDKQYLPNAVKGTINYNNVIISNISPDAAYMQFAFRTYCMSEQEVIDNNYQVMLVKGSTAPDHYIPFRKGVGEQRQDGYYVPLTISQQGQTDKTYDIYIGDSPLTEGQQVSKTSTGQDIELFEGVNVVSTTLYNKPEMEINYK